MSGANALRPISTPPLERGVSGNCHSRYLKCLGAERSERTFLGPELDGATTPQKCEICSILDPVSHLTSSRLTQHSFISPSSPEWSGANSILERSGAARPHLENCLERSSGAERSVDCISSQYFPFRFFRMGKSGVEQTY